MKFFSKEDWDNTSDENKEILEDYCMELEVQGKAPKTIYQYKSDIKAFLCWNAKQNKDKYLLDLKRKDFVKFQLGLTRAGTSNARINRFQSSIRNMLQYCVMEEDMYPEYTINPMMLVKGLEKKSVKDIYFLTDKEVNYLLFDFLLRGKIQIALWVSMCYDTCARRNEILQIEKTNILKDRKTNLVVGKRGKSFQLSFSKRTQRIAREYLKQRGNDDEKSLWVLGQGKNVHAIKYSTFYDWARMCADILNKKEGKNYKFGPHVFRHTGLERLSDGTHYLTRVETKQGALDINTLKVIAHHSDISTTQNYLQDKDLDTLGDAYGVDFTD